MCTIMNENNKEGNQRDIRIKTWKYRATPLPYEEEESACTVSTARRTSVEVFVSCCACGNSCPRSQLEICEKCSEHFCSRCWPKHHH